MDSSATAPRPGFLKSFGRVFSVFFFLGRRSRRFKLYAVLSQLPAAVAVFIQVYQAFLVQAYHGQANNISGLPIFSNVIMTFDLQFLILLLALFYGTSICLEEVEGRTLMYLTTRPVPKSAVILGKYAAYALFQVIMINVGIVLAFLVLSLRTSGGPLPLSVLLKYCGVLTLGILAYTAFFTLLGTLAKRALLFGLLFGFGWETVVQYFPGTTQRFTIAHYLKSMLPPTTSGGFSFLMFRLEPTSPLWSVLALALMTAGFLGLACLVFSWKDYILDD